MEPKPRLNRVTLRYMTNQRSGNAAVRIHSSATQCGARGREANSTAQSARKGHKASAGLAPAAAVDGNGERSEPRPVPRAGCARGGVAPAP